MNSRIAPFVAWLLCAAIVAVVLVELTRLVLNGKFQGNPQFFVGALVESAITIAFVLVGTLILSKQTRNVIGWLLILPALAFAWTIFTGPIIGDTTTAPEAPTLWLYVALYVGGVSWVFFVFPIFLIALLFPTGKVLSPRWQWVVALAIGMVLFFLVVAALAAEIGPFENESNWTIPNPIGFIPLEMFDVIFAVPWAIGLSVLALSSVVSLVLRYRRAGGVERQQLKWLLFAAGLFAAAYIPAVAARGESEGHGQNLSDVLFLLGAFAFPIAIGIAILRYRLWEIDILIRRTVTYALVGALLAAVYFGSVVVLQQVFARLMNLDGSNSFVTVLSTLGIAALFIPLRNKIQVEIDKRFNRKKYDAQQVMEKFARTVRDETDIDKLTNELVNVVQETMQPKSVSVWLKQEERGKR